MTESYRPSEDPPRHAPRTDDARARFVDAESRQETCRALEAGAALVVSVEVSAAARGRLGDVIDEAIERELDARGAAPPGIGASSDRDAALSDQLFRARRVGASGIALSIGPLRAATSPVGALEPEDGTALRFWAGATSDRPVCLLLDESDLATGAYAEPIALGALILRALESDAEQDVVEATPTEVIAIEVPEEIVTPEPTAVPRRNARARSTSTPTQTATPPQTATPAAGAPTPTPDPVAIAAAALPPVAPIPTEDTWGPWYQALAVARGPQPLGAFERLFASAYMPLLGALADGVDDPRAHHAVEEFRNTFARAYSDAFPTFAVTGKRPRMVLDAFDVAAKIARLHGARSTQLLVVDAMRFDVGARVLERVRGALGSRASLTDEVVLWSALPTTTARQLETLARGVEALKSTDPRSEREGESLRGRTADVIRRIRLGSRDVCKLDAVEARLREDARTSAFDAMAIAASDAIVRHAATLKPRTLLFVFGDHGFTLDRDGNARHGGSTPEEVLVPGFAMLVADVH